MFGLNVEIYTWFLLFFLSSGDVFVIQPLDYEASHEYYITVEATDGGSPPLSDMATVNINLTDVNDNRPVFSQDVYTAVVSEDAELGKTLVTVRTGGRVEDALALFYPPLCHYFTSPSTSPHYSALKLITHLHLWKAPPPPHLNEDSCSPSILSPPACALSVTHAHTL